MLFKKLLRTMRLYRAQFISMIIMIVLGVGIFVGFNMEWVSIEDNMASFFEESDYADYRIISESGFSKDELKKNRGHKRSESSLALSLRQRRCERA